MRTKAVLFTLFTLTLFAFATVVTVLFNTAPISYEVILLFYGSLGLTLVGLLFFAFFAFLRLRYNSTPPWLSTVLAARWAVMVTLFISVSLLLRSYGVWNVATALVLIAAVGAADLLFRRRVMT